MIVQMPFKREEGEMLESQLSGESKITNILVLILCSTFSRASGPVMLLPLGVPCRGGFDLRP